MSEKEALEIFSNIPRQGAGINNTVDYRNFYHQIEPHIETIRTALLKSADFEKLHDFASNNVTELEMKLMTMKAQVDGLVKALNIIHAEGFSSTPFFNRKELTELAGEAIQRFNGEV